MNVGRGRFTRAVCLVWVSLVAATVQATETLMFGYSYHGPPFHIGSDQVLEAGIVKDVSLAIADALSAKADFVNVPVKRVDQIMDSGKVDVLCMYHPHWVKRPDTYVWGPAIFHYREMYVATKDNELEAFDQLKGKVIGTNLGYEYGARTMQMFNSGQANRLEMVETSRLYELLGLRRINALIDSEVSFYYLRKLGLIDRQLMLSELEDAAYDLSCAINRKARLPAAKIVQAMSDLKAQGVFENIYSHYR